MAAPRGVTTRSIARSSRCSSFVSLGIPGGGRSQGAPLFAIVLLVRSPGFARSAESSSSHGLRRREGQDGRGRRRSAPVNASCSEHTRRNERENLSVQPRPSRPTVTPRPGSPSSPPAAVPARRLMAGDGRRADGGRWDPARRPHRRFLGCAADRGARGGAERDHSARARGAPAAADAGARLPARVDRGRPHPRHRGRRDRGGAPGRQLRLGSARVARGRCRERRARGRSSARTTCPRSASRIGSRSRQGIIAWTDVPGIVFLEIDGLALPVLRRAMRDGNAPTMARWLADGSHQPGGVGDRSLLADRREPGRDPAGIERGHLGLPLGGEGDGDADDVLGAARLRGDRAAALRPASACSPTAAPAAATCSPAKRTR